MFVFVDEAIAAGRSGESKGQRVVSRVVVGVGAGNSAVVVDLPRCGPMLSPRVPNLVPNLVPIPGPRMERETPGQRPRPNNGHPQPADDCPKAEASLFCVTPALHSTNGTSNGAARSGRNVALSSRAPP